MISFDLLMPACKVNGYDCGYATCEGVQEMSGKQLLRLRLGGHHAVSD